MGARIKKLFARFLWWFVHRLKWTVFWHLPGYMERWWIRKGESRDWLWGARIHHILRSDLDRHLHDHPWNYITIILKGGYYEQTPKDTGGQFVRSFDVKWYGPGSILIRRYDSCHKLILPDGQTCWTLFMMGRWRQTWGFYTEHGKVPYQDYEGA